MIERGVVSEALRQVFTRYKFTHDFLPPQSFRQVAAGFPRGYAELFHVGNKSRYFCGGKFFFI